MRFRLVILSIGLTLVVAGLGWMQWADASSYTPPPLSVDATVYQAEAQPPTTTPSTTSLEVPNEVSTATKTTTTEVIAEETPRFEDMGSPAHLWMDSVSVYDDVLPIPLEENGAFNPEKFTVAWYELSSNLGERGTTLIGAHVAWKSSGPDRFALLGTAKIGDLAYLRTDTGNLVRYEVEEIKVVHKDLGEDFLVNTVFADNGEHQLWLVTCGGTVENGEFDSNVYVHLSMTADQPEQIQNPL